MAVPTDPSTWFDDIENAPDGETIEFAAGTYRLPRTHHTGSDIFSTWPLGLTFIAAAGASPVMSGQFEPTNNYSWQDESNGRWSTDSQGGLGGAMVYDPDILGVAGSRHIIVEDQFGVMEEWPHYNTIANLDAATIGWHFETATGRVHIKLDGGIDPSGEIIHFPGWGKFANATVSVVDMTIDGLKFFNFADMHFDLRDMSGMTIRNCTFAHACRAAIRQLVGETGDAAGPLIEDNLFESNLDRFSWQDMKGQGDVNQTMEGTAGLGLSKANQTGAIVRRNTFTGGGDCIVIQGAHSEVYGNVIPKCMDDVLNVSGTNRNCFLYDNNMEEVMVPYSPSRLDTGCVWFINNRCPDGNEFFTGLTNLVKTSGTVGMVDVVMMYHNTGEATAPAQDSIIGIAVPSGYSFHNYTSQNNAWSGKKGLTIGAGATLEQAGNISLTYDDWCLSGAAIVSDVVLYQTMAEYDPTNIDDCPLPFTAVREPVLGLSAWGFTNVGSNLPDLTAFGVKTQLTRSIDRLLKVLTVVTLDPIQEQYAYHIAFDLINYLNDWRDLIGHEGTIEVGSVAQTYAAIKVFTVGLISKHMQTQLDAAQLDELEHIIDHIQSSQNDLDDFTESLL